MRGGVTTACPYPTLYEADTPTHPHIHPHSHIHSLSTVEPYISLTEVSQVVVAAAAAAAGGFTVVADGTATTTSG